MRGAGPDPRRITLIVMGCVVLALLLMTSFAPSRQAGPPAELDRARSLRAFRIATGVFAVPVPGRAPAFYGRAEAAAREAGAPLAHTVWVQQESFETDAWRDLLQVGRFPISRPPKFDFAREVAVLVWPMSGIAPDSLMRAHGLNVEGLHLAHFDLELRIGAETGGAAPATPVNTNGVVPYGIFTISRAQFPLPAPPPTEPPLLVTLAR